MSFLKTNFLRSIIIISIIIICGQVFLDLFFIYPSFIRSATEAAEDEAVSLARHLIPDLKPALKASGKMPVNKDLIETIETITQNFNLYKLKLFNQRGLTLYSTDVEDIDKINETDYFQLVMSQGQVFTKTVRKDSRSLEGQLVTADVVETYVPIIENDIIIGALEIYYNVTRKREKLSRQFWISTSLLLGLSISFLFIVICVGNKMMGLQNHLLEKERLQVVLEMAGMVCHEINQPLMTISGYSEMLLADCEKDNDLHPKIKIIKEQTDRLGEITAKLMKITKYKAKDYLKGRIIDLEKASETGHKNQKI